MKLINGVLWNN